MGGPSEASLPPDSICLGLGQRRLGGDQPRDVNWAPPPAGDPSDLLLTGGPGHQTMDPGVQIYRLAFDPPRGRADAGRRRRRHRAWRLGRRRRGRRFGGPTPSGV